MGQTLTRAMSGDATAMINAKNQENPVMVYSKTYCPYCSEVKSLFGRLNVPAKVVELDNLADGDAIQAGLQTITGRRTVPQVFIAGKHVGGCDGEQSGEGEHCADTSLARCLASCTCQLSLQLVPFN